MILPPRPLRLRPAFVRKSWEGVVAMLAPALAVLAVVGIWQGRAAWELWQDQRAWDVGEPVPVRDVRPRVTVIAGLVRHVRIRVGFETADGISRGGSDDYYTFVESVGAGPPEVRYDAASGRFALSWSMEAAPWRWAWIAVFAALLGLLAAVLAYAGFRALSRLRTARAAARASDEVELDVLELITHEVHGREAFLEVRFRAPAVAEERPAGYRVSAREPEGRVRSERFVLAEGRPILLDDDSKVLALRPSRRSDRVTLVRDDLWPFALGQEALERVRRRLRERTDQPPEPASFEPASETGPASGMATHSPSSSNT